MSQRLHYIFAATVLILFQNCAPSRFVKPLAKKQQAVAFSFGGPLIRFAGAPVPLPFTTVTYGYGVTGNVTAFGSLHPTSLLFGNLQSDIGATFKLYEKETSFGFSASPALQAAYNLNTPKSGRLWPSLDINAYYHPQKKASYLYGGIGSWFELSKFKAHREAVTQHFLPNINTGYVIVNEKWLHQFQLSYMGLGNAILPGVADYIGISGKGAIGLYYSLTLKF